MLKEWEEAVGKLTNVMDNEDYLHLEFTTVWSIGIPKISESLTKKIHKMIGENIGIIRTDIPGKEILVRKELKQENACKKL